MAVRLQAWGKSHRGQKRNSNQDSMLIDPELGLYIVADGMGGMGGPQGGEIASKLAVETAHKIAKEAFASGQVGLPRDFIHKIYSAANDKIYARSREENERLKGMGTTMVLAFRKDDDLYIGNVGDSRCYYFSCPYLWQATEDHSLINEQIRAGLIKESQRPTAFGKNLITRSVGYESEVECDIIVKALSPGDMFLMCSDGLSGLVPDERISDILMNVSNDQVADRCVLEANWSGGDDNVTALVIKAT
jgi:PPM family protein phosphatase